jgi:hypothetical protein
MLSISLVPPIFGHLTCPPANPQAGSLPIGDCELQITELWPEHWAGSNVVARFSVRLSDELKLVGLKLHRKDDGSYRVRPPNRSGAAAFHIGPKLAREMTVAAVAALTGGRAPRELSN